MPSLAALIGQVLRRQPDTPAVEFEGRWFKWGWFAALADTLSAHIVESGAGSQAPVCA